jgi:NAD(P)-dependent dehydrogenase (short-subunit alcohol dehydrogenase family)
MNVVVGGASGMGEAIAHGLAERGPLLVADCDAEGRERSRPRSAQKPSRATSETGRRSMVSRHAWNGSERS